MSPPASKERHRSSHEPPLDDAGRARVVDAAMVEGVVAVGVTGPFQQLVVPKRFLEDDGVVVVVVVVVAFMLEDLSRCRRSFAACVVI